MVRVIYIAVLIVCCALLACCRPKPDNNFPNGIKIGDLKPVYKDGSTGNNILKAINIDFHVLEIPEENFSKLDEIRRTLSIRPIKFNNYLAFSANLFSVYYGRNQTRGTVYDLLQIAGAQHVGNQAIILVDGESTDIPIQQLPQTQAVYFSNLNGELEAARIGPGYLAMHIKVEKSTTLDDYGRVTICTLFSPMTTNTLRDKLPEEYKLLDKVQDFSFNFTSTVMQLDMTPGDFIFLAPEQHSNDQEKLSSLFFNNPQGSLFFNPEERKPPERKPTIRVYLITCLGLNF